jgi:hypothetical protein
VGDEREKHARPKLSADEPDVEAHASAHKARPDEPDQDHDDDKPDVEAHYHKNQ